MALDIGHHSEKIGHGRGCVGWIVDVLSWADFGRHDKERRVSLQTVIGRMLVRVARLASA